MSSVIICDQGSHSIKCGFAGSDFPQHLIPSVIGNVIGGTLEEIENVPQKSFLVGDEAFTCNSISLTYPIPSKRLCTKPSQVSLFWDEIFRKLEHFDLFDCKLLITMGSFTNKKSQNELMEILFERYPLKAIQFVSPLVALYSQGLLSGVVVDCGETAEISTYVDGANLPSFNTILHLGGRDMQRILKRMLTGHGYKETSWSSLQNFIEKYGYIAENPDAEKKIAEETCCVDAPYILPDGQTITLGRERFLAPEILFEPWLADISTQGISDKLAHSLMSASKDIQKVLAKNIVLCGGCSAFPGMATRMEKDLNGYFSRSRNCTLTSKDVRVTDPPNRQYLMYQGASVLGKLMEHKDDFWISRDQYFEENSCHDQTPDFEFG